ncbi:MAG: substrate-binding domain-containing protein [Desulfobacterales bacterium]|nr:substrate-binding domain-containing protein [Desulfobacterales bacterium]
MRIKLFFLAMVVLTLLPALAAAGDVVVIANPLVGASSLSKQDVGNIYQGKKSTWDDGSKIVFVVLKGSAAHEQFLTEYVGKNDSQFDTFWKKQVFTGQGSPPQAFDSEQAMLDFVAKTAGAIGYVSANAKVANVKTITVQ